MPPAGVVGLAGLLEPAAREGGDRAEELEPGFAVRPVADGDQADVDELPDRVQGVTAVGGDRGRRIEVERAGEDAELPEEPLLVGGQQPVAPGDGVPQRLLPGRPLRLLGGQQFEIPGEPRPQRAGAEQFDARCGELDGERQPVEQPADLRDVVGVVRVELESGPDEPGPLDEQLHRAALAQLRDVPDAGRGQRQRRHRVLELAVQVQRTPRGREDREAGRREQLVHDLGCGGELFEVVQDQQGAVLRQLVDECRRAPVVVGEAQPVGDRRPHDIGRGDRFQRDEVDPAGVSSRPGTRARRDRQAGLAGAARSGQRDELRPVVGEQPVELVDLPVAADRRGRGGREPAQPPETAQRREVALEPVGRQLVEADGLGDVLEPVPAEVEHRRVVRSRGRSRSAGSPRSAPPGRRAATEATRAARWTSSPT